MIDVENPVVLLCMDGSRAEFAHRHTDACACYQQAWDIAADDYERCIAAHYVARCQTSAQDILAWNQIALEHAQAVNDERVTSFFPSLYVNLGHACEQVGQIEEAQRYYDLAAASGTIPPRRAGNRD
jgi:tetratricopeptide (TPR) repeat protein